MAQSPYHNARSLTASVVLGLAFAAGTAHAAEPTAGDWIARASDLLSEGELVRSRALLVELSRHGGLSLDDNQSARVFALLTQVERRLRSVDPDELSVQKAKLAFSKEDFASASRYAVATLNSPKASPQSRDDAQTVLTLVEGSRIAMRDEMRRTAERGLASFEAGEYADAKRDLRRVEMIGADLDESLLTKAGSVMRRIVDLELARGGLFDDQPIALSVIAGGPEEANWLLASNEETEGSSEAQPASQGGNQAGNGAQMITSMQIQGGSEQPAAGSQPDPIDQARASEALRLLGEADQAFDERMLSEAAERYQTLRDEYARFLSDEEMGRVTERLAEARVQIGARPGDASPLEDEIQRRSLARQRTEAQYMNQVEQARASLEQGEVDAAGSLVEQAQLTINQGTSFLSESAIEAYNEELDQLRALVGETAEQIRIDEQRQRDMEIEARATEEEASRRLEKEEKIVSMLHRVRQLQKELNFNEALQVVEQILFLDPTNPAGLLLRDVISDTMLYRRNSQIQSDKRRGYANLMVENESAMIPPERIVQYPDDWPAISLRRGEPLQFSESAVNRGALSALRDTRIPVDFYNNALVDVLAFVEDVAEVNMDVDWKALASIGVSQETPITLSLTNVPVEAVLDRVLKKAGSAALPADWSVQDGIVTISSEEALRKNTVLEVYDIRDLLMEIQDYRNVPEFDLNDVFNKGEEMARADSEEPEPRKTDSERAREIADIIQATIDPDGWTDLGGDTSSVQEINGNLIITSTPAVHTQISGLLGKLRQVRAIQISVEARVLLVSENFFEQIGFDVDLYLGGNSNQFQIARIIDPGLQISDFVNGTTGLPNGNVGIAGGTGSRNVTSGAGIQAADADGDGVIEAGEQAAAVQPVFAPGTFGDQFSIVPFSSNSNDLTSSLIQTASSFASTALGAPALRVAGTYLDDIQVDFLIEATQADQRSVSMTAPRITFSNGQVVNVAFGRQEAFVSALAPIVATNSAGFNPTISTVGTGVSMLLEGAVSADRRYVTMHIQFSSSQLEDFAEVEVALVAGGTAVSAAGAGNVVQLPISVVQSINTTVTIPDQGTVLFGGQRSVSEFEVETGVPVLSKIPILSRFFSNRAEAKEEQTLLMLIKPTILIQNEEEELSFPGLSDSFPY